MAKYTLADVAETTAKKGRYTLDDVEDGQGVGVGPLAERGAAFLKEFIGSVATPKGAAEIATTPITKPLSSAGRIVRDNPEGAIEAIPTIMNTVGGVVSTAGKATPLTAVPAMGFAGVMGAGAEGFRQTGRALMGKEPVAGGGGLPGQIKAMAMEGGKQAMWTGAFPAAKAALNSAPVRALGRGAARLGQAFSGVKAGDYARLADDPAAILPEIAGGSKSMEAAGDAYGAAAKGAGLKSRLGTLPEHPAVVRDGLKKVMDGLPEEATEAATEQWIKENVFRLSPQESLNNFRSAGKVLEAAVEGKDKEAVRTVSIFKDALRERLSTWSPEFGKASKDFARSALGDKFTNLVPLNKYGSPSIGRAGFTALATGTMGGAALASPVLHGLGTAGVGTALKSAKVAGSYPGMSGAIAGSIESEEQKRTGADIMKSVRDALERRIKNGQR
jgi:hypothetical protein